jgi:hypothetical protein
MRGEGIVPVMEVGNNNGFGNGFGNGDGAWWIIILLLFGWGRNGFGGFGGNGGIGENYVLQTDFATIERKLDGINNGICDATFALNNTINQGFFGVQNSLTQGFGGLNTALLQGNYALSSQLADCCCKTQRAIDGVNYNMAQNTCTITNNATMNARDIIDAVNTNYRALHEELVANKLEMKNERIAEQQNEINALRLRASQEAQNNYLISQLRPCPDPAYIVPNPNCCYNYTVTQNSCGCGNF